MVKHVVNRIDFGKMPVMAAPDGKTLNIFVFGGIGGWWGANKNDVLLSLKGKKYSNINLVISSPGGDLSEALTIRDLLKSYPANVTSYLTGLCASAATILADAGDKVIMSKSCIYMIHKPLFSFSGGNADQLRKDAEILDRWENIVLDIYNTKTGLSDEVLSGLMREEAWVNAESAKTLGFVDEVVETLDIDFDIDSAGTEREETFMTEKIYFQNTKTVFNQAVTTALNAGYRQIGSEKLESITGIKKSKILNMKEIYQNIVNKLVEMGIISGDKKEAAMNASDSFETPEMVSKLIREEVTKHQPSMKVEDITALIKNASNETKQEIASALGVVAYDDKTIKTDLEAIKASVAALIVGEGAQAASNGELDFEGKTKKGDKTFKEIEAAKMYLSAVEKGDIDRATYKQLTGEEAPKKKERS